jgi:multiple sugar transport system substrate-binding protein
MQRREFLQSALGGLGGLVVLASCGGTNSASQSGPVKLSLANDKPSSAAQINELGKFMIDKYKYGIQSQPYQDTSIYQGVIRSAANTPKAPPLFTWWSGFQLQELVRAGSVADLTPQVQKWIKDVGLGEDIQKAFQVNGKYYAVPFNVAYWVIFYNKKVFSQYGLQAPTTWQDFITICDTLKGHGVTPIGEWAAPSWTGFIWFENILINTDPNLYENLMQGKAKYTDPGVVKAMQLLKDMHTKGYLKTLNANDPPTDFVQGKQAMQLVGQWWEPTVIQAGMKPGTDFDAFIMPAITSGLQPQLIFEAGPIVVAEHSASKQKALQVLETYMRTDVQKKWVEITNFVSGESSVPPGNDVNTHIDSLIKDQKPVLHNRYWEATPPQIAVSASEALIQALLHPETYMQVLQNCQSIADQYWSSQK